MPERDVVSWNSMISGYVSSGCFTYAFETFTEMQIAGVRPSGFTFSILLSTVPSACYGKQIHGSMIRSGVCLSNVVLGNSLIDMYGRLGFVGYAFAVFSNMKELDIISWNSLISGCLKSGYEEYALDRFRLMRSSGYSPDDYTVSTIITACSNLRNLGKGKQIFALCVKVGFVSNSIVLSASIDLFSKCNRLEYSIRIFEEVDRFDSAVIDSMISTYGRHGFEEDALQLFVLTLRDNFRPNEFTLSSILSSISTLPLEQGCQIHSLAIKLGFESEEVVASSLMEMYSKFGSVDSAMRIFVKMDTKDMISWNTIIMGLSCNGRVFQTLDIFNELLKEGPAPDRITFTGVLLACKYGGLIDEGMIIFSSMEKAYGVTPGYDHYACIIDLLCRVGKLKEAIDITNTMPYEPSYSIWESILRASAIHEDLSHTETVAERMMEMEPHSSLPYLILAQQYERRGRLEAVVGMRKIARLKQAKKVTDCSCIGTKNHIYTFKADQLHHHGGKEIYLVLGLLSWEMEDEVCIYLDHYRLVSMSSEDQFL
ncbi:hypothetical protein LWI29_017884 [Acer saccharum]|uniref:Pentatricopeptide repeat-containing protein n=1 Tax=Acer saccharum TaxID=4024 RepID=A0AA39VDW2_ACESA|nr:hypothetical protein LWI29_017884 [Acer saccharum]